MSKATLEIFLCSARFGCMVRRCVERMSKMEKIRQKKDLPPEANVFLVTGELVDFSNKQTLAMGYVIADSAEQAVSEQLGVQSNLRVGGVVSLAELKRQVRILEEAREGAAPVLVCGSFKS